LNRYSTVGEKKNVQMIPGKIAVITEAASLNEEVFHSPDLLLKKYGAEKVIHVTWPDNFMAEQNHMADALAALSAEKDIKALIINQALPGTNAAVDMFRKRRRDVFIVYCMVHEPSPDSYGRANLLLGLDEVGMGQAMVKQAKKQGAKVFVHYSFPRHMAIKRVYNRWNVIRKVCSAEGILFVNATAPDSASETGLKAVKQFIYNNVPKLVAEYGEDTAFYGTNCAMQVPLIKAVMDCHAIYTQPCCPSPFHGFPQALGIKADRNTAGLNTVINEACRIAEERNMSDRLSTWPVSVPQMFTNAGAEYAIKWMNGLVAKDSIDSNVLETCIDAYIKGVVGEGVEVTMTTCLDPENGAAYDNYKLLLMSYLDF